MPSRETGKQRAIRIPLDYYKQRSPLDRWKLRLTAVALVVSLGWWASGYVFPARGNMKYAHGPVAWSHAGWEAQCEVCHLPFSPINGNDWAARFMAGGHARAGEFLCKNCHGAPEHHLKNENPASVNNCGSCHRDHQGRDANLNRVADVECTRCHANLDAHAIHKPDFANQLNDFTSDHPDFRAQRQFDPSKRTLKFSHQQHMTPGQVLASGAERPWTFEKIADAKERSRYMDVQKTKDEKEQVQLNCIACHQLDCGDFKPALEQLATLPKGALLPPRAAGSYFRPIVFENHCQACHPLNKFDDKMQELTVPHRMQPTEMKGYLEGSYIELYLTEKLAQIKPPEKRMRLDPLEDKDSRKEAQKAIEDHVKRATLNLFAGTKACGKCHDFRTDPAQIAPKEVVPPEPHVVWYEHAKFDHVAHRAVDCRGCHAGADAGVADAKARVIEKEPLLLPGIDNCKQCHAPSRTEKGVALGGARNDCAECHTYHNGDKPQEGLGATARDPETRKSDIDEFLSGKRK
ncbi:MAG: hypothetical protein ACJ8FY_22775 [Gemmataceae bacterium]